MISTDPSIDPAIVIWWLATGSGRVEATVIDTLRYADRLKVEGVNTNQAKPCPAPSTMYSLAGRRTATESPPKAPAVTWKPRLGR